MASPRGTGKYYLTNESNETSESDKTPFKAEFLPVGAAQRKAKRRCKRRDGPGLRQCRRQHSRAGAAAAGSCPLPSRARSSRSMASISDNANRPLSRGGNAVSEGSAARVPPVTGCRSCERDSRIFARMNAPTSRSVTSDHRATRSLLQRKRERQIRQRRAAGIDGLVHAAYPIAIPASSQGSRRQHPRKACGARLLGQMLGQNACLGATKDNGLAPCES